MIAKLKKIKQYSRLIFELLCEQGEITWIQTKFRQSRQYWIIRKAKTTQAIIARRKKLEFDQAGEKIVAI